MRITTIVSSRMFLIVVICLLLFCIAILLTGAHEAACSVAARRQPDEPAAAAQHRLTTAPSAPPMSRDVTTAEPDTGGWPNHTLCVVVPFRDRFEEMLIFVPYMHRFLNHQKVKHHIYIVNQIDSYRFNRASLINVGYLRASEHCDYIAMHDVDLLPLNRNLSYAHPGGALFHVASPEYHPRYHYPKFVGGVLLIATEHFAQVNGMSNNYWGWGLEDDEFYTRIRAAGLDIARPANLTTTTKDTFRHIHDRRVRKRDMEKCFNQAAVTHRRDRITGVDSVDYKILKANKLSIDGAPVEVLNVRLGCDHSRTPWCDCSGQADQGATVRPASKTVVNAKTSAGRAAAVEASAPKASAPKVAAPKAAAPEAAAPEAAAPKHGAVPGDTPAAADRTG